MTQSEKVALHAKIKEILNHLLFECDNTEVKQADNETMMGMVFKTLIDNKVIDPTPENCFWAGMLTDFAMKTIDSKVQEIKAKVQSKLYRTPNFVKPHKA